MEKREVELVRSLEESIERKLNAGGAEALSFREIIARLGSLTDEEFNFLGHRMGWDREYFDGVDWNAVPSKTLALAAIGRLLMDDLRAMYPAPATADLEEQL